MLRRQLILNLGPLVIVLVVTAVTVILMLQGVLRRLDDANRARTAESPSSHVVQADPLPSERKPAHLREEERALAQFRTLVVALGVVFVLVINLSIVLLVRMATLILRPVEKLLVATREMSRGNYYHRVQLDEADEFNELAGAYNALAERMQSTENLRMEVLAQAGLALNHDLNNAMATIELQLGLLGRSAGGDVHAERRLRTIQDSLARMKGTVQSLKNVRRIVLTDYGPGVKMLDLERSAEDSGGGPPGVDVTLRRGASRPKEPTHA